MTVVSIDVVTTCDKCGPRVETIEICGTKYCANCVKHLLDDLGVPRTRMTSIEKCVGKDDWVKCSHCGSLRPDDSSACPTCGIQSSPE